MNIMHVLMMPNYYLKMVVIIKIGENANEYHAGFDDAKKVT